LAISQRNDAVLVYDMHEYYLEQIAFDPLQKKLLEHWEEIGLAQALISYTVSQPIANAMQERYRLLSAPGVITNALKVPAGPIAVQQGDRLRAAVGAREGDKILLYHGGFVINRNLEKLIEGFGLSSREDVVLVLMGYGDLSFAQDALRAAAATSRIVVLPAVPAVELSEWVVGADAVVIPYPSVDLNTTLCAPNKLFDCIALGVPLLVNQELENVGAILEEFGIGSRIDLTSSSSVSCAISAWKGEPIALSRFEAAQIQLGWEAQEQKLLTWIHVVEEEVERRRSRSEDLAGQPADACVAAQ
jgi:glycosyltransferase involved in cell wall biosynthesis